MTQAELAEEMSVRLGREFRPLTVTRLEGGKRPITVEELLAAAEALHVPAADLLSPSDLRAGAIRLASAGQDATKAANGVERAVREWVRAQSRLRRVLESASADELPAAMVASAQILGQTSVDELVSRAVEESSNEAET